MPNETAANIRCQGDAGDVPDWAREAIGQQAFIALAA
jgi:hypothetical protein